jgi:hypothetical protein
MDVEDVKFCSILPVAGAAPPGVMFLSSSTDGGRCVAHVSEDGVDIGAVEREMLAAGRRPAFRVCAWQQEFATALERRGYEVLSAGSVLGLEARSVSTDLAPDGLIYCEAPLASARELWTRAGYTEAFFKAARGFRGTGVWLLTRSGDRPSGCAFLAAGRSTAMVHAPVSSLPAPDESLGALLRGAANWAMATGLTDLCVALPSDQAEAGPPGFAEVARWKTMVAPLRYFA